MAAVDTPATPQGGYRREGAGVGEGVRRERERLLGPRLAAWLTFNDFSNFVCVCVCGLSVY